MIDKMEIINNFALKYFAGKRVLLSGACGMLAFDLLDLLAQSGALVFCSDLPAENALLRCFNVPYLRANLSKPEEVERLLAEARPEIWINCAAYTAVDRAEEDYSAAFQVNALAVANIARAARQSNCRLLHFSTDYVFGDYLSGDYVPGQGAEKNVPRPLSESFVAAPNGIYGWSKLFGEILAQEILGPAALIVRTSWLHGPGGPNFLETMLTLARSRTELKVVDDQLGSPTYTAWLAAVALKLLSREAAGVFHASSRGGISWFDFAAEIFQQAGIKIDLQRQSTVELGRPAPRPAYAVFELSKLESFLGEPCISWQEGIAAHLARLKQLKH